MNFYRDESVFIKLLRKNIYVLIDEAHRTTGGDFGTYLMAAVLNATLIGFTGTLVDKTVHGKGTFKTFGIEDESGYLHKYSIAESIEDYTTLPLFYGMAPNELLVPKEILEKEFSLNYFISNSYRFYFRIICPYCSIFVLPFESSSE